MRQIVSKYREFPIALEWNSNSKDSDFSQWKNDLGLRYNRDYILFEYEERRHPAKYSIAVAFKNKDNALLYKLRFAGL
jgi:hypothetical protein